jgi:hypothetical protein
MPDGERYARVLHPAGHREQGRVRWSRVAEWSGRELTPISLFDDVTSRKVGEHWSSVGSRPHSGELDRALCAHLGGVLSAFTAQSRRELVLRVVRLRGFGGGQSRAIQITPRITASGRRYLLCRVPVTAVGGLGIPTTSTLLVRPRPGFMRRFMPAPTSPNFWWPDDRAWFLSTEVDAVSTYIGGPAELIERLPGDPAVEALPARLEDPLDGVHPGSAFRNRSPRPSIPGPGPGSTARGAGRGPRPGCRRPGSRRRRTSR